ncbi:MAG: hypothetical protein AB9869_28560 [Verrucomicrobiia bacterium]
MKLRFEVNQSEAFRKGINCPRSIVSVEVNPADLEPSDREMLANCMDGIEMRQQAAEEKDGKWAYRQLRPRIRASAATLEALLAAVENEHQNARETGERLLSRLEEASCRGVLKGVPTAAGHRLPIGVAPNLGSGIVAKTVLSEYSEAPVRTEGRTTR